MRTLISKFLFVFILVAIQGCLSVSTPDSNNDEQIIDPGIIERTDGGSEVYIPPSDQTIGRLDDTYLDQYFSNKGMCEIRLYSCPTGYVAIPEGTDSFFPYTFFELSHGDCINKGYDYRQRCGVLEDVVISFSSPYDTVVSTTIVGGIRNFGNPRVTCEVDFAKCQSGGAFAKFELPGLTRDEAVDRCLSFASERSLGCNGGILREIRITDTSGFNLTHNNFNAENHQTVNSCQNQNETIEFQVDFSRADRIVNLDTGIQTGFDFRDVTNRAVEATSRVFYDYSLEPLSSRFYRTFVEDRYTGISIARNLRERGFQIHLVQGGTPKYVIPMGSPDGALGNGMPNYSFDSGNQDYQRLINGIQNPVNTDPTDRLGGIKNNMLNMRKTAIFPHRGEYVIEPWDSPDYLLQENYSANGICYKLTSAFNCDFYYGDDGTVDDDGDPLVNSEDEIRADPWTSGLLIDFASANPTDVERYVYSMHETYVTIMQEILKDNYFALVDFAGPSLINFNKAYMQSFMDYCLYKRRKIQETDPGNRGCEVNYITWHAGDHYEDQLSQIIRDINWVQETFVNNPDYIDLNIKGIVIVGLQGKRDFFVPAAALRQLLYIERTKAVSHTSRSCWFRSCEDENSLGGLLKFDSSATGLEESYERSNIWWTNKFFSDAKQFRVRSSSLDDKGVIMASSFQDAGRPTLWMGSHYRDNKKRNFKIMLRNLGLQYGNDGKNKKIIIKKDVLPTEYFNLWTSEDAIKTHLDGAEKKRGISINPSTDLTKEVILELPTTKPDMEVCLPDMNDGDLYRFSIEFAEQEQD